MDVMGSPMPDIQRVEVSNEAQPVERASAADLAFLAMDTGRIPQQFAVILILDRPGDFNLSDLRQLISGRIRALPRLRQRLIKVPPGCGRAVWWMILTSTSIATFGKCHVSPREMSARCLIPPCL
jgi:hypothetical protein